MTRSVRLGRSRAKRGGELGGGVGGSGEAEGEALDEGEVGFGEDGGALGREGVEFDGEFVGEGEVERALELELAVEDELVQAREHGGEAAQRHGLGGAEEGEVAQGRRRPGEGLDDGGGSWV